MRLAILLPNTLVLLAPGTTGESLFERIKSLLSMATLAAPAKELLLLY